jgi:hypothetical protein
LEVVKIPFWETIFVSRLDQPGKIVPVRWLSANCRRNVAKSWTEFSILCHDQNGLGEEHAYSRRGIHRVQLPMSDIDQNTVDSTVVGSAEGSVRSDMDIETVQTGNFKSLRGKASLELNVLPNEGAVEECPDLTLSRFFVMG